MAESSEFLPVYVLAFIHAGFRVRQNRNKSACVLGLTAS
jgi:hypothetical protein